MAQQHINLGTPPSGVDGDTDRQAWVKAEANFTEIYAAFGGQSPGELAAQVQQNTDDIATLKPEVAQNTTDIGTNKTNIATNTSDLATLKPQVSTNTTNIGTLQTQMAALNPAGAFKNKFINGNFDVWQRGGSFNVNQSGAGLTGMYTVDRWALNAGYMNAAIVSQGANPGDTAGGATSYGYAYAQITTSSISDAVNCQANFIQRCEGVMDSHLRTMTVSFRVYVSAACKIGIEGRQAFGIGGSPSPTVSGIGNVVKNLVAGWNYVTATLNFPSISGKTMGNGGGGWFGICIWLACGSGWGSAYPAVGQQVGTWTFHEMQCEWGSVATPFEVRPYVTELSMCQRFYNRFSAATSRLNIAAYCFTGTQAIGCIYFPVTMRASPTCSFSAVGTWRLLSNGSGYAGTSMSAGEMNVATATLNYVNSSPTFVANAGALLQSNDGQGPNCWVSFDAEL